MTDDRCLSDLHDLDGVLRRLGAQSVFLVADAGAYEFSGAEAKIEPILERMASTTFTAFEPNPKLQHVLDGVAAFQRSGADVVVAIGGGTAIDIAKLVVVLAESSAPLEIVRGKRAPDRAVCPLIAVPTTSGSGSEATQFAVVYVDGVKHSVDHACLLPRFCVLDPELTSTLPAGITAHCGLDAFCQAIESLWSVRSTERSLRDAVEAARLAFAYLPAAVHAPTPAARAAMCRASHLAGRAIHQTRTTAPHAISYAITSGYGVPHGQAVALTLGPMLLHNAGITAEDSNDRRGISHVRARIRQILDVLGCETPKQGCEAIQKFVQSLGCRTRLSDVGVRTVDEMRGIAEKVDLQRLGNNPRKLTTDQLVALLQSLG